MISFSFIDSSGRAWYMYSNRERVFIVDTNGFQKPNALGKDRQPFQMLYSKKRGWHILPYPDKLPKQRWCPDGGCYFTSSLMK